MGAEKQDKTALCSSNYCVRLGSLFCNVHYRNPIGFVHICSTLKSLPQNSPKPAQPIWTERDRVFDGQDQVKGGETTALGHNGSYAGNKAFTKGLETASFFCSRFCNVRYRNPIGFVHMCSTLKSLHWNSPNPDRLSWTERDRVFDGQDQVQASGTTAAKSGDQ